IFFFLLSFFVDAFLVHISMFSSFFGYKTHLAMTEERIITAAVVTTGEKGDGPEPVSYTHSEPTRPSHISR
ncbi:hypothetical protein ACQ4LD_21710, partial [Sphingobacterium daejeonense]